LFSVVEVNVSIMCSCMPSYATLPRRHLPALRNLGYRLRSKFYSSHKQHSSTLKLNDLERVGSDSKGDEMRLTLGSAVRGGKFLQTQQREWPLRTMEEDERQTEKTTERVSSEGE
jgi:hypothetical protein